MGAQYAIMRFAKYKGPEISGIEAHNERTKEKYASNPDVDTSRSHLNFHLIEPQGKYRAEAEKQIAAAGCRTRTDSVRLVEMLVTASPEFFKDKKREEIRTFFQTALDFIRSGKPVVLASDAHDLSDRKPNLIAGRRVVEKKLGAPALSEIDALAEDILQKELERP